MNDLALQIQNFFGPGLASAIIIAAIMWGSKIVKPTLAGADATSDTIKMLQAERAEWKKLFEETHKLLDETKEQNGLLKKQLNESESQTELLRMQAQMMYRLLERHGAPAEDLRLFEWLNSNAAEGDADGR